jgi:starvation-inducible DNA-binding protein
MAKSAIASLTPEASNDRINTGLKADYRKNMAKDLSDILAATYRLTIKSHIYHWNVVGPIFKPIHELTEEHYNELFGAAWQNHLPRANLTLTRPRLMTWLLI